LVDDDELEAGGIVFEYELEYDEDPMEYWDYEPDEDELRGR
jgi:hypothetical protein